MKEKKPKSPTPARYTKLQNDLFRIAHKAMQDGIAPAEVCAFMVQTIAFTVAANHDESARMAATGAVTASIPGAVQKARQTIEADRRDGK